MAEKFKCKRGVLITPDKENNGAMTPFFIKTRTKDIYTNSKTVDIFNIEEYADRVVLRTNLPYSELEFYDKNHFTGDGAAVFMIFFPYTFKNDKSFLPTLTLRTEEYNYFLSTASLSYIPIYTNESKVSICGMKIIVNSTLGTMPSPSDVTGTEIGMEIVGTKDGVLNFTVVGMYKSSSCVFKSPSVSDLYYYSLPAGAAGSETEVVFHRWYGVSESSISSILNDNTAVDITFYYDEDREKMLIKYKSR